MPPHDFIGELKTLEKLLLIKFADDNRNRDLLEKYKYREGRKFQKNSNLAICLFLNKACWLIGISDHTCLCVYVCVCTRMEIT